MNISGQEGWYSISRSELLHHGAGPLLAQYRGSIPKLLTVVYPQYTWDLSKFTPTRSHKLPSPLTARTTERKTTSRFRGYWDQVSNQRLFLDDLGKKLNITDQEGWYKVTRKILRQHGGDGLIQKYNCSPHQLLTAVYPEYKWDRSKFTLGTRVTAGFWQDVTHQQALMNSIVKQYQQQDTPWLHNITTKMLRKHGAFGLLLKYGSIGKLLTTLYPEYSQACRTLVMKLVHDLNLSKVEDLIHATSLLGLHLRDNEIHILRQHNNSFEKCTQPLCSFLTC